MSFVISSGHGLKVRGASGYLDEVDEARKVVDRVAAILTSAKVPVKVFHDNTSTSQNQNLQTIVNYHNSQQRNWDVSVHFNAYQTTSKAMGTETLYVSSTGQTMAAKISPALAKAGGFINRGAKKRTDLYFLNKTTKPAVLLEVCFVDSSADTNLYRANFEKICSAIASTLSGVSVPTTPPPEPQPEPPKPPHVTGSHRIEMEVQLSGDVTVWANDELVAGNEAGANVARLKISKHGDAVLVVNGEEFHNYPEPAGPKPNHTNIEATVFGGANDPNNSAYPPYALLNGDRDMFVALPYSWANSLFPDNAPKVKVIGPGGKSAIAPVADKGPWTVDDGVYVIHATARPIAEQCFNNKTPLPSGPNKGRVPSNKAGIDLSPALAKAVGISGKGIVSWEFVEGDAVAFGIK